MRPRVTRRLAAAPSAVALLALLVFAAPTYAAPKPKPNKPDTAAPATPSSAPADVNDLSLRVTALQTLHDFDLSTDQLHTLRALTPGVADTRQRSPAKSIPKLAPALRELHDELLKPDAEHLTELSAKVDELLDDNNVDLDDGVRATDAARAKAPEFARRLKSSQIAAYLADHAAEVSDPVEQMMGALAEAREEDPEDYDDADAQDMADDVARLVAGRDAAKAKQISTQVLAWFKSARALKDEEFAARQGSLEQAAQHIVGVVNPIDVLSHWLDGEIAELLANPQLPAAIDATLAARTPSKGTVTHHDNAITRHHDDRPPCPPDHSRRPRPPRRRDGTRAARHARRRPPRRGRRRRQAIGPPARRASARRRAPEAHQPARSRQRHRR